MNKELRMYGFVGYWMNGIQKSIQFGHAIVEYSLEHYNDLYKEFAKNHKTFIVLDGGTSNSVLGGTMEGLYERILGSGIEVSKFHEPDQNNVMTAMCFIADEPIFNHKDYPFFKEWFIDDNVIPDSEDELIGRYPEKFNKYLEETGIETYGRYDIKKLLSSSRLASN